jgi:hypothetical protein
VVGPTQQHSPEALGITCRRCGGSRFRTGRQTFADGTRHVRADCATCGAFVRYLKQPGAPEPRLSPRRPDASRQSLAPPSASWRWLGWIRQADQVWRPVAEAATLEACWDVLLHYPGEGDRLCIPSRVDGKDTGHEATD